MFKAINNGTLPTRGSKHSACIDLYANEDVTIGAGETVLVGLGVCIDLELLRKSLKQNKEHFYSAHVDVFRNCHYLQLMLRSSLGKQGLILPNGVGVIDLDYKDELKMIIHNTTDRYEINKGDRIGQITLLEHKGYLFGIESEEDRNGGFGSTNTK